MSAQCQYSFLVQRGIVNTSNGWQIGEMFGVKRVASFVAAGVLLHGLPFAPALADDCLNDWGMAGQIVRQENLITVEEVSKSLAADGVGELVKTTLCRSGNGYFYRLVIRAPTGELKTTVMVAKSR